MAFCGDKGSMMNAQELETAVRLKLSLVVLVVQGGRLRNDRRERAVDGFEDRLAFDNAGFVKHAEAYGIAGRCVGSADSRASTREVTA